MEICPTEFNCAFSIEVCFELGAKLFSSLCVWGVVFMF